MDDVDAPEETEESLDHMCQWAEENNHITRVKYLSAMPGTTVYRQGLESGHIRDEVEHLRWLAVEQALERDEYLNYNNLPDHVMRRAYNALKNGRLGPVMVEVPRDIVERLARAVCEGRRHVASRTRSLERIGRFKVDADHRLEIRTPRRVRRSARRRCLAGERSVEHGDLGRNGRRRRRHAARAVHGGRLVLSGASCGGY